MTSFKKRLQHQGGTRAGGTRIGRNHAKRCSFRTRRSTSAHDAGLTWEDVVPHVSPAQTSHVPWPPAPLRPGRLLTADRHALSSLHQRCHVRQECFPDWELEGQVSCATHDNRRFMDAWGSRYLSPLERQRQLQHAWCHDGPWHLWVPHRFELGVRAEEEDSLDGTKLSLRTSTS